MCVEIASGTAIGGLRAGGLTDVTPEGAGKSYGKKSARRKRLLRKPSDKNYYN